MIESGIHHIVFLERNTFTITFREPAFPHEWIEFDTTAPDEIIPRLKDATIAIVNKLPLRARELAQLPHLKLIAVAATGVDNIDLPFCRAHNIAVCNTREYAVRSLPEHVLMLMLSLRRNLFRYQAAVDNGKWQVADQFCLLDHPIEDLNESTLGVIGYGSLGQAVAQLASGIGMNVLVAERKNAVVVRDGRKPFPDVLKRSDVITLHCPLTDETRNLIGWEELQMMKPTAILINTARGGLVDEAALISALKGGIIAGAGFDVLSTEPPRQGNPLLEDDLPNLIVTPHTAWASQQAMRTLADQLVDNLEAFVGGEPKNLVV